MLQCFVLIRVWDFWSRISIDFTVSSSQFSGICLRIHFFNLGLSFLGLLYILDFGYSGLALHTWFWICILELRWGSGKVCLSSTRKTPLVGFMGYIVVTRAEGLLEIVCPPLQGRGVALDTPPSLDRTCGIALGICFVVVELFGLKIAEKFMFFL